MPDRVPPDRPGDLDRRDRLQDDRAEPDVSTVRRVEGIAVSTLTGAPDSEVVRELELAVDQVRADRTNGEPMAESFARLCEAVAAVRNDRSR
jgi:hypothetical protein